MSGRDYRQELTDMIDRLLAGTWTVDEFQHAYYDFWLDEVPRGVLSDDDEEFFSDVQENLDWKYVDWVRLHRIGFAG